MVQSCSHLTYILQYKGVVKFFLLFFCHLPTYGGSRAGSGVDEIIIAKFRVRWRLQVNFRLFAGFLRGLAAASSVDVASMGRFSHRSGFNCYSFDWLVFRYGGFEATTQGPFFMYTHVQLSNPNDICQPQLGRFVPARINGAWHKTAAIGQLPGSYWSGRLYAWKPQ